MIPSEFESEYCSTEVSEQFMAKYCKIQDEFRQLQDELEVMFRKQSRLPLPTSNMQRK
jgi:hypothetical protein